MSNYMDETRPEKKAADLRRTELVIGGKPLIKITSEPFVPDAGKLQELDLGEHTQDIKSALNVICQWINSDAYEDTFNTHKERRLWEETLDPADLALLYDHKFRGNPWSEVYMLLGTLPGLLRAAYPDKAAALIKLTEPLEGIRKNLQQANGEGIAGRETYTKNIDGLDKLAREAVETILR